MRERGLKRVALQLTVPAAVGLLLGGTLAFQAGSSNSPQTQLPLGTYVTPSASPTAITNPAKATKAEVDCDLIVPANPLSAQGLATPYQLTGTDGMTPAKSGCEMTNAAHAGAFVQATILDPATGQLSVYDPLVITRGTTPAVVPRVPPIPANAVVTIDIGFNGKDLVEVGATPTTLADANCVTGPAGSPFGQASFCNGVNFFQAVGKAEREGLLKVPSPGTSDKIIPSGGDKGTGQECPVTRNFEVADQDSPYNVTTEYILNQLTGQTAQDTLSNMGSIAGGTLLSSGSDSTVLDMFLDPILGCTPLDAPELDNNDQMTTSLALDEILAAAHQPKVAALVPENYKTVMNGDELDQAKTDMYREEVGEAPVSSQTNETSDPEMYCQNLVDIQTPFLAANQKLIATSGSPAPAVGDNLLTFMASQLSTAFTNLGCRHFGLTNPVKLVKDGAGAATAATFNTSVQTATAPATATGGP